MHVIIARWRCRPEDSAWIEGRLAALADASRKEAGCLSYLPHRQIQAEGCFAIVEQYTDEAAFQSHVKSEHFKRIALGEVVPRLLERAVEHFAPLGAGSP
jgi:quinol monooxygenase YgiN